MTPSLYDLAENDCEQTRNYANSDYLLEALEEVCFRRVQLLRYNFDREEYNLPNFESDIKTTAYWPAPLWIQGKALFFLGMNNNDCSAIQAAESILRDYLDLASETVMLERAKSEFEDAEQSLDQLFNQDC